MNRPPLSLVFLLLLLPNLVPAAASVDSDPPPGSEFTFARIRYHMSLDAAFQRELPWHHDYPYSDETFAGFVKGVSNIHTSATAYQIVDIDSPQLFLHPFAYLAEPGFLELSERDAENLRNYLHRGGFIFFDDFRGPQHFSNLVYQMKKVLPDREFVPLALAHPVFDTFYKVESLAMPPPYGNNPVEFWGIEDDHGRLIAVANYNNDLGEVWQWLDEGRASLHDAAESLKLGTNYLVYALTH
jgi:hypothetical protein